MKFEVFHRTHPTFGFDDAKPLFPKDYDHVATVEASALGAVFQLTNHIDRPWWENEGVTLIGPEQYRSTSVGDVVKDEAGTLWLCDHVGWKPFDGIVIREEDELRTVVFKPYRKGMGPVFTLFMWDTNKPDGRHAMRTLLGYRLRMSDPQHRVITLFQGEDFGPSPCFADDSDKAVAALMGFLTLRSGDTDSEYFKDYTPVQEAFAAEHAEALSAEVIARFGED